MERTADRPQEEITEIERHKYFLSEQAGHDVGWEFAEQDWEEQHGRAFRKDQPEPMACPAPSGGISMLFRRMFGRA